MSDSAGASDAGRTLAAAFTAACLRRDRTPDPDLRLLAGFDAPSTVDDAPPLDAPHDLGVLHERLEAGDRRRRRGAWYTPAWLAAQLVADAVRDVGVVADPACGGGAFLLAAADRLHALGADPADIVESLLWGADIDPLAVAVAEAALWWWSADAGAPTVAGDRLVVGDALVDVALPSAHAVVGNPPFLGQLKASTTVDDARRQALRQRWGSRVRPYTDAAWLFLAAAADAVEPGGRVAMIQPQSLLGARDAAAVRDALDRRLVLEHCWVDDGAAFAASVDVCAPVLHRPASGIDPTRTQVAAPETRWTAALADAHGVPDATMAATRGRLGDAATVVAGFRDEYYGLVDAVTEAGDASVAADQLELVTSGSIDPLRRLDDPVRFAKQRWTCPRVDHTAVAPGRAARWVEVQRAPKVIVATQTKVLEAVVDPAGSLIASVPAIAVVAHDPDRLWHLAAALHAPVISAWMLRRTAGTALAAGACKPTAAALAAVPLPGDDDAWDTAADLARAIAGGADEWEAFAAAADAAYGVVDPATQAWWLSRLPVR